MPNDIQPEMLGDLRTNVHRPWRDECGAVLGSTTDPKLPTTRWTWPFSWMCTTSATIPYEIIPGRRAGLKPGGRLVFVEYRGEEQWIPIKPLHKMIRGAGAQGDDAQPWNGWKRSTCCRSST